MSTAEQFPNQIKSKDSNSEITKDYLENLFLKFEINLNTKLDVKFQEIDKKFNHIELILAKSCNDIGWIKVIGSASIIGIATALGYLIFKI